jgi:hypothetical protein
MVRLTFASAALCLAATPVCADQLLFDQPWTSTFASPDSVFIPSVGMDLEVADDFDLVGSVGRLMITGNDCGSCPAPAVLGVYVRFHEWTAAGPGALQQETFVPGSDPGFLHDPVDPALLDITLPTPFQATGKHFVSVQLAFESWSLWGWWLSNKGAPDGSTLLIRDGSAGNTWSPFVDVLGNELLADAAFQLWSGDSSPPDPGSDPCGDWVEVPSPNPAEFIDVGVWGLSVNGPDDAWAVGTTSKDAGVATDHFTFTMHWDGATWTQVQSPSPALFPGPGGTDADLVAVDASGPDDVWAAGSYTAQNLAGFSGTQILVLHWDGTSWSQAPAPNSWVGSGNYVTAIEVVAEDDVWFVGDWLAQSVPGGGVTNAALAMHWDGSSFTIHETPYPGLGSAGFGLNAIDAVASDDIWAVGGGHDGDMAGQTTYLVHWDGSSWTHVPASQLVQVGQLTNFFSVEALATDDVWVSGSVFDGVTGFPVLLHWDGSDWSQVASPAAGAILHEVAPGEMYALTGKRILRDGGAGFVEVMDFSSQPGVGLGSIASAGGDCGTLMVAGVESVVGDGQPFTAQLVPTGPFVNLGNALAGTLGTPSLTGSGQPTPASPVTLAVTGALPQTPVIVVAGFSVLEAPLLGGVLVPSPDVIVSGLASDSAGQLSLPIAWPGFPAGTTLVFQAWIPDAGGVAGFAATNGLQITGQ